MLFNMLYFFSLPVGQVNFRLPRASVNFEPWKSVMQISFLMLNATTYAEKFYFLPFFLFQKEPKQLDMKKRKQQAHLHVVSHRD